LEKGANDPIEKELDENGLLIGRCGKLLESSAVSLSSLHLWIN
jgi:hypothetical protein